VDSRRLVAHRGYPRRYPENTLIGVEAAVVRGAKYVEVDVQLSADRRPVLFHDRDLRRMCGVEGGVHERTLGELRELRASEPRTFGDAFRDVRLATLEELVALLADHPDVTAFVEVKRIALEHHGADAVAAVVLERLQPLAGRCVVISFAPQVVREARRRGWAQLGFILREWSRAARIEAAGLAPEYLLCDVRKMPWLGDISQPGCRVAVYDVVHPRRAKRWAARGADLVETFAIGEMLEHFTSRDGPPGSEPEPPVQRGSQLM
jgi:glycerophosphoryl diester phosphodiesterase